VPEPTTIVLLAVGAAIAQRPDAYVCPSDVSEPYSIQPKVDTTYDTYGRPAATGSYALVEGTSGAGQGGTTKYNNTGVFFYLRTFKVEDIPDGLSKTLFLGEVVDGHTPDSTNIWSRVLREMDTLRSTSNPLNTMPGEPINSTLYGLKVNGAFASRHPGGANFAFGDGHVVFITENIDPRLYRALSTREGGEVAEGYE